MNSLDRRMPECPYCKESLKKTPAAKTKCPRCGESMFVRTRPQDGARVVVTTDEARRIEEDWGVWNDIGWWTTHNDEVRNTYPAFHPHLPDEDWLIPNFPTPEGASGSTSFIKVGGPNRPAAYWARKRTAELVGMVRGIGGAIVPNPDARWAISEATRDGIKQIISDGFEGELQPVNGGKRPPYLQPGENREGDIIDHINMEFHSSDLDSCEPDLSRVQRSAGRRRDLT